MALAYSKETERKTIPEPTVDSATKTTHKIVAIDDDPMTLRLLQKHLGKDHLSLETAANGTEGLQRIDDETSVAIIDLRLPDLTGFQILEHLQQHHPRVQVIVLTGSADVSDAVEAMRVGATHYITKPFDPRELLVYVEKAIASQQIADENRSLKESYSQNLPVRAIVSSGDIQNRLMQQVEQIAHLDSTVFIGGETGTGKSTIARMIHQRSARAAGPFVTVNCASLPRELIQSELFGHTKGAFTGALSERMGHAEVANNGTLFLDEIGDLPLDLQPKLLTFLQDRTVQRLGASESKTVNVRLIAATHRDLAELCRQGTFRQDLYFRLLVLNLELPPLRHRSTELTNITESILTRICERQGSSKKTISAAAMQRLISHSWPGNIRELENVIERAIAYSGNDTIEADELQFSTNVFSTPPTTLPDVAHSETTPNGYQLAGKTLQEIERDAIIDTLKMLGGNKAKSARTLGISEKSIYNKMRRLKIEF